MAWLCSEADRAQLAYAADDVLHGASYHCSMVGTTQLQCLQQSREQTASRGMDKAK